ncbi:serine/threonine protein kinase [Calothrix sp. 336/3]|uniref:serine/threonine protein kinase n=1 Tax=Calothrix sp. 336/3 TaxID=1337936 RepID=UPI0004E32073|nr:serine/threonine-protein kinase [Calothrix sp. 336/3]AKG21682.1 serine/threonine protein kinase [Calothrix sp. 336/3]
MFPNLSAIHCINPDCLRPYPQPEGGNFCHSCGTPLQLINRYVAVQRLGEGGFAQIYSVWDQRSQTEKVLKVLVEESPKALELFTQEASFLSSIRHPGVPRVDVDGYFQHRWMHLQGEKILHCLVMEKIHGQTLEEIQQQYLQGCPEDLVLDWFSQLIDILQHLHQRQIIHRDIKPANLMLRNSPQSSGKQLVLIDFGGAKQVGVENQGYIPRSTKLFSSGYSPPEQVIGGGVTPVADFYALGRTMLELLTGKYPGDLEDPLTGELKWRHLVQIQPEFADLLDEMMQIDARSRPANTAIIQQRLAQITSVNINTPVSAKSHFGQSPGNTATQKIPVAASGLPIQFFQPLYGSVVQVVTTFSITTGLFFQTIFKIIQACLDTIWTSTLTIIGILVGIVTSFFLSWQTNLDKQITNFISFQFPGLLENHPSISAANILLFACAGMGTAWGITTANRFGQKRRLVIASGIGAIAYTLGYIILQIATPQYHSEGLVCLILTGVSLMTLGLGIRSHQIVYAIVTAFGTAMPLALLLGLGVQPGEFEFLNQVGINGLLPKIAFFLIMGVCTSFWLAVSHYLIVPFLRLLGWR